MAMLTSGAKPCLSCETEGGSDHPSAPGVPRRSRGLCHACYIRAWSKNELDLYPACGQRPVGYAKPGMPYEQWTPAPWGRVPFGAPPEALPVRWQSCPPRLPSAPTARINPDAHRRTIEAQAFAASWLAQRSREAA